MTHWLTVSGSILEKQIGLDEQSGQQQQTAAQQEATKRLMAEHAANIDLPEPSAPPMPREMINGFPEVSPRDLCPKIILPEDCKPAEKPEGVCMNWPACHEPVCENGCQFYCDLPLCRSCQQKMTRPWELKANPVAIVSGLGLGYFAAWVCHTPGFGNNTWAYLGLLLFVAGFAWFCASIRGRGNGVPKIVAAHSMYLLLGTFCAGTGVVSAVRAAAVKPITFYSTNGLEVLGLGVLSAVLLLFGVALLSSCFRLKKDWYCS